jgi:hypothetical protein
MKPLDRPRASLRSTPVFISGRTRGNPPNENGPVNVMMVKEASPEAALVSLNTGLSAKFLREARRQNLDKLLVGETTLL